MTLIPQFSFDVLAVSFWTLSSLNCLISKPNKENVLFLCFIIVCNAFLRLDLTFTSEFVVLSALPVNSYLLLPSLLHLWEMKGGMWQD